MNCPVYRSDGEQDEEEKTTPNDLLCQFFYNNALELKSYISRLNCVKKRNMHARYVYESRPIVATPDELQGGKLRSEYKLIYLGLC